MSDFLNQITRRKFIVTAGVSASAVLLKGCLGNPPETTGNSAKSGVQAVANISPEQKPETTKVKLGYIPIVESAPLIIALEKGFFQKYGMSDVEISKQASWGIVFFEFTWTCNIKPARHRILAVSELFKFRRFWG